ncbi:hypothetical protein HU200_009287 [Digitaria exilis]|uniref:Uncharacterized protein n=1 Tax=Digitaria exilis TaxID=1010633 RepID=A0A835KQZ1_9POAL|nr:hypothetical protein HU200_009287 [Digitaria exilis]
MPEPQAILPLRALPPTRRSPSPSPSRSTPRPLPPRRRPRPQPLPRPRTRPPPPPQTQTPAAPPSSSSTRPPHPWEIAARAWLESVPDGRPRHRARGRRLHRRPPSRAPLPPPLPATPAPPRPPWRPGNPSSDYASPVYRSLCNSLIVLMMGLVGLRFIFVLPFFCQVLDADQSAFPYRFQRTDLWKPVYQWLESLDMDSLVATQQISDWLTSNPKIMDRLVEKHSKYHLIHYTQRMHLKMLKKKGKLPKTLQLSAARATTQPGAAPVVPEGSIVPLRKTAPPARGSILAVAGGFPSGSAGRQLSGATGRFQGGNATLRDKKTSHSKKKEALLKYELLTDLQNQLTAVLLKQCRTVAIKEADSSHVEFQNPEANTSIQEGATTASASALSEATKVFADEKSIPAEATESELRQKRKRNPIIVTPAWCYSEAPAGLLFCLMDVKLVPVGLKLLRMEAVLGEVVKDGLHFLKA